MKYYISDLDTQRFGFKVAKINDFKQSPQEICKKAKKSGIKLIITRVSCKDINIINQLEDAGFRLKDTQLTYKYDLNKLDFSDITVPSPFELREANVNDTDQIVAIAEKSFNNYGHYFADDRLDKQKCLEIYKDWTRRTCINNDLTHKVLIIEDKDNLTIVGYQSLKINDKNVIGLITAVLEKYRNRGIVTLLKKKSLLWAKNLGADFEETNALSTNFPMNRVHTKIGFKLANSFHTFHCWV